MVARVSFSDLDGLSVGKLRPPRAAVSTGRPVWQEGRGEFSRHELAGAVFSGLPWCWDVQLRWLGVF